jgi:hypothetical protein
VDSVDGAVEFVRFVVAMVNRAHNTPSTKALDDYITPTCLGCQDIREAIAELERLGQRTATDTWFVTHATPNTWSPRNATVVVRIHQKPVDFLDAAGRRVGTMAEDDQQFLVSLKYESSWRIVRWQQM